MEEGASKVANKRMGKMRRLRAPLTDESDGEVFGDVATVLKQDNESDIEFDLVSSLLDSSATEQAREDHVDVNLEVARNVSVSDLNVLDLRAFLAKSFR